MTAPICHLATPTEWDDAQASGWVAATFDAEGFVHCSTPVQLIATIERHFAGVDELRILVLDAAAIADALRWEEGRPGEQFPHVYRPISTAEVTRAVQWVRSSDGAVGLPAELADLS